MVKLLTRVRGLAKPARRPAMAKSKDKPPKPRSPETEVVHGGRNPADQYGFVNTPVYRGSTVLFPTVESLEKRDQAYFYGRRDTPTQKALREAICELEGGSATVLTPSGLSAIAAALLALVQAGDNILVTDSIYGPARRFCDQVLTKLGVQTTYYDPLTGSGIAELINDRTRLVFTESPGSLTFEIQDLPAISEAAHKAGAAVVMDNTWATPLHFKPFEHGVDVSIQAATKYIIGHADGLLGSVTANPQTAEAIIETHGDLGLCPGSEETFLALRGLRTLAVRLERHWRSGLEMAHWLKARPEVARVLHPALEDDPGHAIWARDFIGACGLFSIILKPCSKAAMEAMLNGLALFGMGWSWGGFESLVVPVDSTMVRTATQWQAEGPTLRFHIGLENVEDLKGDLEEGFQRLRAT